MLMLDVGTDVSKLNETSKHFVDEILDATGLNWNVKTSGILYGDFGQFGDNEGGRIKALYREDTGELIDCYRAREPRQNKEIISFFVKLLSLADLKIERVGSFGNEFLWATAKLEDWSLQKIAVGDTTESSLLITDSHLSNNGMKMALYHTRLVCLNGATTKVKVKNLTINHTKEGVNHRVARECLNKVVSGLTRYKTLMEGLTETPMSADTAMLQLIQAFGDPTKSIEKQPDTVKSIFSLFDGKAQGAEMMTAYKTAYGLLQAVTEYYSHSRHTTVENSLRRFQSLTQGTYNEKIQKVQQQLVRLV